MFFEMKIEEAIKLAEDNGYNDACYGETELNFIDRDFWIALGKSLGWDRVITDRDKKTGMTLRRGYLIQWHRFIDHLSEGKTPAEFFRDL